MGCILAWGREGIRRGMHHRQQSVLLCGHELLSKIKHFVLILLVRPECPVCLHRGSLLSTLDPPPGLGVQL